MMRLSSAIDIVIENYIKMMREEKKSSYLFSSGAFFYYWVGIMHGNDVLFRIWERIILNLIIKIKKKIRMYTRIFNF
jgi:hypothetical protein